MAKILNQIKNGSAKGEKGLAVLIDPDKDLTLFSLQNIAKLAENCGVNFIFLGGSTVQKDDFDFCLDALKSATDIPVVLFPGHHDQVSEKADALLYLSLISGRNPEFLIGQHVKSAAAINELDLEVMPTSYILVDGGKMSSVQYVSQTTPIPNDQIKIITDTALAGKMQGHQLTYMDAGSGALNPIPENVIQSVKRNVGLPLIIGGGIRSINQLKKTFKAGADIAVIGNAIEDNPDFIIEIKDIKKEFQTI